jgi:hypothetical protein
MPMCENLNAWGGHTAFHFFHWRVVVGRPRVRRHGKVSFFPGATLFASLNSAKTVLTPSFSPSTPSSSKIDNYFEVLVIDLCNKQQAVITIHVHSTTTFEFRQRRRPRRHRRPLTWTRCACGDASFSSCRC